MFAALRVPHDAHPLSLQLHQRGASRALGRMQRASRRCGGKRADYQHPAPVAAAQRGPRQALHGYADGDPHPSCSDRLERHGGLSGWLRAHFRAGRRVLAHGDDLGDRGASWHLYVHRNGQRRGPRIHPQNLPAERGQRLQGTKDQQRRAARGHGGRALPVYRSGDRQATAELYRVGASTGADDRRGDRGYRRYDARRGELPGVDPRRGLPRAKRAARGHAAGQPGCRHAFAFKPAQSRPLRADDRRARPGNWRCGPSDRHCSAVRGGTRAVLRAAHRCPTAGHRPGPDSAATERPARRPG